MPSLSQCVISGTVYDVNGDPVAAGFRVSIQKTVKSGQIIQWVPDPSYTTTGGAISLTAPRSSTIYVYAKTVGLQESGFTGVALTVPNTATANLEDLISISTFPSTGLTVKDEGTAFANLVGTINFVGAGVSAVETSPGLATVTITGGAGGGAWGTITGTLSDQTDLQTALTARALASGGTIVGLTSLGIRSTGAAFDLTLASSEVLTGGKTLSFVVGDTSRTLTIGASASVSGSNTGDQTSVSGNAGTATALQTAHAIYGNNFNGTADLTQIIASTFGGTGNGFTKFSGPTTAEKTFTLPDATTTILTTNAAVTVAQGGTGVATLASNGVLYGNGTGVVLVTTQGTANSILTANAGAPSFSQTPIIQTSLQLGVVSSSTGLLKLANSASANLTTIQAGNAAAARTYTWPTNFGAAGTVLTDAAGDGTLSWAAGGSGANTALSNLASVAINTDLLPASTQSLGNASFPFLSTFTGNTTQYESVAQSAGLVTHSALGSATNIGWNWAPKGTGLFKITSPTVSGAAVFEVRPVSGTSFTRINDNGTVVIDSDVSTGSTPLTVKYNGGTIMALSFGGALSNLSSISAAGGVVVANSSGFSIVSNTALLAFGASSNVGMKYNATGVAEINNGTAGQWGALLSGVRDGGTTTVTTGLSIGHQSSSTPAAKFGAALAINANSSTTADQSQSLWYSAWQTATHASRRSFAGVQSVSNGITLADRLIIGCTKTVGTNNTAITLCDIALPTLQGCAGELVYKVFAKDATNVQVRSGIIRYSAVNKAAAYTSEIVIVSEAASASAGTLTATASITTGTNLITLNLTPNTSLTATTHYIEWSLSNLSESTVTVYTD